MVARDAVHYTGDPGVPHMPNRSVEKVSHLKFEVQEMCKHGACERWQQSRSRFEGIGMLGMVGLETTKPSSIRTRDLKE